MHGPAALALPMAGDGGGWRRALLCAHLLAAAALLGWNPGWPTLAAALALCWLGLRAWRDARRPPATLAWDGQDWRHADQPVQAGVALDLGGWMLLRLTAAGGRRVWLPLSPAGCGAAWTALRATLYATPYVANPQAPRRQPGDPE